MFKSYSFSWWLFVFRQCHRTGHQNIVLNVVMTAAADEGSFTSSLDELSLFSPQSAVLADRPSANNIIWWSTALIRHTWYILSYLHIWVRRLYNKSVYVHAHSWNNGNIRLYFADVYSTFYFDIIKSCAYIRINARGMYTIIMQAVVGLSRGQRVDHMLYDDDDESRIIHYYYIDI